VAAKGAVDMPNKGRGSQSATLKPASAIAGQVSGQFEPFPRSEIRRNTPQLMPSVDAKAVHSDA